MVTRHNSKHQSLQSEARPFWFCQHASVGSWESNPGRVFPAESELPGENPARTITIPGVVFVPRPLTAFGQEPENITLSLNFPIPSDILLLLYSLLACMRR